MFSKRQGERIESLKSSTARQRSRLAEKAWSSQEADIGVPRDDVVYFKETIEKCFNTVNKKFAILMDEPLKDYDQFHESCNNILLTNELKSGTLTNLDDELIRLVEEKKVMEKAKTEFEFKACPIPSLLKIDRQWLP